MLPHGALYLKADKGSLASFEEDQLVDSFEAVCDAAFVEYFLADEALTRESLTLLTGKLTQDLQLLTPRPRSPTPLATPRIGSSWS